MKSRGIVNLPVGSLTPHPENPRKDLGDLTEMAESIKKNGVLQNLTVIPKDIDGNDCNCNNAFKYMVIIGHRRLAAAKAAGIDSVPCRIVEGMTHDEQLLTMLEENMQRSDLTIYDQAQGFQLMLDLGQTIEDIEEKSGFSKATIYHRLNIAKLDKDLLKEKTEDTSFQLSITDLIELEKVKDVEARNKILKKATSSQQLKYLSQQEARDTERREKTKIVTDHLESLGVQKLPKDIMSWQCDRRFSVTIYDFDPEKVDFESAEVLYWSEGYECVNVYAPKGEKTETKMKEESPKDKAYRVRQEAINALKDEWDRFKHSRISTLEDIALRKLQPDNEENAGKALWKALMAVGGEIDLEEMTNNFIRVAEINLDGFDSPEEANDVFLANKADIFEAPLARQCAIVLMDTWFHCWFSEYSGKFMDNADDTLFEWECIDTALRNYGFIPTEEDKDLLAGTSPLLKAVADAAEEYNNL